VKKDKQCPKCLSLKIGFIAEQIDRSGELDTSRARFVGEHKVPGMLWGENDQRVGNLEAYVCTVCGYFESYVAGPASVPWEDLADFRWINAAPLKSEGPFR
jgi:predicted nucleic-acid-binding Zn-ribbon protein